MSRPCTLCSLPAKELAEVNRQLATKETPYSAMCAKYDIKSKSSVSVHVRKHLPVAVAAALVERKSELRRKGYDDKIAAEQQAHEELGFTGDSVLADLARIREAVMTSLERVETASDDRQIRESVKVLVPLLTLMAKTANILEDRLRVSSDIASSEEFQDFLAIVLRVLSAHPQAHKDLLLELERLEERKHPTVPLPIYPDEDNPTYQEYETDQWKP